MVYNRDIMAYDEDPTENIGSVTVSAKFLKNPSSSDGTTGGDGLPNPGSSFPPNASGLGDGDPRFKDGMGGDPNPGDAAMYLALMASLRT